MNKKTSHISIGKIVGPWGLVGACKLNLFHRSSESLFKTRRVYLQAGFSFHEIPILNVRRQGRSLVLHLKGYKSPEQVQPLKGQEIFLHYDDLPQEEPGEYYIFELKGLTVFQQNGEKLGHVDDVVCYGASDLLVIKNDEGQEFLIPFIPDFVKQVFLKDGRIEVEWEKA